MADAGPSHDITMSDQSVEPTSPTANEDLATRRQNIESGHRIFGSMLAEIEEEVDWNEAMLNELRKRQLDLGDYPDKAGDANTIRETIRKMEAIGNAFEEVIGSVIQSWISRERFWAGLNSPEDKAKQYLDVFRTFMPRMREVDRMTQERLEENERAGDREEVVPTTTEKSEEDCGKGEGKAQASDL